MNDVFAEKLTWELDEENDQWFYTIIDFAGADLEMGVDISGAWWITAVTVDRTHARNDHELVSGVVEGGEWTIREAKWACWKACRRIILRELQSLDDEDEMFRRMDEEQRRHESYLDSRVGGTY